MRGKNKTGNCVITSLSVLKGIKMRIFTVSNRLKILSELYEHLTKVYPEADIIEEIDPLMAGKQSFNNTVDMVFADINMKRMTGLQLIQFIRHVHTDALTYIVGTAEEISDSLTMAALDDVTGVIIYPFTEESFASI
jgi:DNA-binding LytR/AlgR family response regulator